MRDASESSINEDSVSKWAAIAIVPAVVVLAFGPILSSPLGPVDDHEYLKYLVGNPTGNPFIAISQGLERAWSDFRYEGRVRPVYHLGRTVGTAIFTERADIRYALRLALAMTLLIPWVLFSQRRLTWQSPSATLRHGNGIIIALTSCLAIVAVLPWLDVIGRLGPPDTTGLFGFALIIFALRNPALGQNFKLTKLGTLVIFAGLSVMSGSRENYAVYAALLSIYFFLLTRRHRIILTNTQRTSLLAFTLFPATAVVSIQLRGGTDFYGQNRDLGGLSSGIISFLHNPLFIRIAPLLLIWCLTTARADRLWSVYRSSLIVAALLSDWLAFGEPVLTYGRYRFISDLALLFVGLLVVERLLTSDRPCFRFSRILLLFVFLVSLIPLTTKISATRNQFDYARRLNLSYSHLVNDVHSAISESEYDSVIIIYDSNKDLFRSLDLRERITALEWSLRRIGTKDGTNSDSVVALNLGSNMPLPKALESRTFCLLVGVDDAQVRGRPISCDRRFRIY